jgi:hypothetical protein
VGGIAVFFTGALGGQVGPGEVSVYGFDGKVREIDGATKEGGIEKARTDGKMLAVYALESLKTGSTTLEAPPLGFRSREIYLAIENKGYQIAFAQQLFDRAVYNYDENRNLGPDNLPYVKTQEAIVDVGPAEMITFPGEMHAELLLATPGGVSSVDAPYPFTPAPYAILNDPKTHPERNKTCREHNYISCEDGPPLIENMDRTKVIDLYRDPKATFRWVLGLTQDELGYVVPRYDYLLSKTAPYIDEPAVGQGIPGDHYEETNSLGPNVELEMLDPLRQLMRTPPVIQR